MSVSKGKVERKPTNCGASERKKGNGTNDDVELPTREYLFLGNPAPHGSLSPNA